MRLENRIESGLARLERVLEQLVTKQDQVTAKCDILAAKQDQCTSTQEATREQVQEIQQRVADITRLQSHLQLKQDQLASKQDLLQSTISNDRPAAPSVVSSPMVSPPLGTNSTWNFWPRSRNPITPCRSVGGTPAFNQSDESIYKEESIDDSLYSYLDDFINLPSPCPPPPHPLGFRILLPLKV